MARRTIRRPAAVESVESARAARLRHVDPTLLAGIRRVTSRGGFVYTDARGRAVKDDATLRRIRSLAIPPAWRKVWVCPDDCGHIQATGFDARGRKQYRYHPRWRAVRDAAKFHRMSEFAAALPHIREACERDLCSPGLPRDKILAVAVRLLESAHMRVGNKEYTRTNGSHGLTTLTHRHLSIAGADVRFHYKGKSGQTREVAVHDSLLARIIAKFSSLPGRELFQYVGSDGTRHAIGSADVNAYIARASGGDFTAKDFRTWAGTLLAAQALRGLASCASESCGKRAVADCIKSVAARLGNTPAVCRKSYVHPAVVEAYLAGFIRRIRASSDERLVQLIIARASQSLEISRAGSVATYRDAARGRAATTPGRGREMRGGSAVKATASFKRSLG
jgi:DNA topoisomerase-1